MDAEQVRREIRETRASIDRKLDLLSTRTSELADVAKDTARRTAAATLMGVGASMAFSWWKRRHRVETLRPTYAGWARRRAYRAPASSSS